MKKLSYKEYQQAIKEIGISYLGSFNQSAKMAMNGKNGVITYSLYLAPANMSGYECCPKKFSANCRELCLNGSGRNKGDIISRGEEHSKINVARIKKSRLFYENRELFMLLLTYELEKARQYAEKQNMGFSVRLNCTSDLSPFIFRLENKNILELYPDVQFYDYTKVPNRYELVEKYPNYHLTFSYDGFNWDTCVHFLNKGVNVAVVFESDVLPISWRGYRCIEMSNSDLRYLDAKSSDGAGFIGHLHFHRPASLYKNGKYERPNNPFVVMEDDKDIIYAFPLPTSNEE
jgi:hypothetical protein